MKKIIKYFLFGLLIAFVLIQFIPVERTNPKIKNNIKWNSGKTLSYAKRACFDCHSNETQWPWYSYVAPVSWIVVNDVNEGRLALNFSDFNLKEVDEAAEEIMDGEMPLKKYLLLHSDADLTPEEKKEFIDGLKSTFFSMGTDYFDHLAKEKEKRNHYLKEAEEPEEEKD